MSTCYRVFFSRDLASATIRDKSQHRPNGTALPQSSGAPRTLGELQGENTLCLIRNSLTIPAQVFKGGMWPFPPKARTRERSGSGSWSSAMFSTTHNTSSKGRPDRTTPPRTKQLLFTPERESRGRELR